MNIDERCYGYEPAASQLGALRQEVATAWAENRALSDRLNQAIEGSLLYRNNFMRALEALKEELQNICDADREEDQQHIDELDKLIAELEEVKL